MTRKNRGRPSRAWMGLTGLGIEFGAAVGGFAVLGWWIDRRYDTSPTGLLICIALGLIGGFYNMIRQSLQAAKQAEEEDKDRARDGDEKDSP